MWRVDRRDTFEALRRGRRRRQGPLSISWVPGDPAEPPRVAFTIGKKVGSAVVRNRLRRRLRMLMRRFAPRMRPGAYLIGVAPEAATLTFTELEDLVKQIMKSLDRP
ncbi:MAG: ribonuclease P protein component [Actinomycetota bacterium]|nr:ribonuclease P protein component [Actinomycetota bacterium]